MNSAYSSGSIPSCEGGHQPFKANWNVRQGREEVDQGGDSHPIHGERVLRGREGLGNSAVARGSGNIRSPGAHGFSPLRMIEMLGAAIRVSALWRRGKLLILYTTSQPVNHPPSPSTNETIGAICKQLTSSGKWSGGRGPAAPSSQPIIASPCPANSSCTRLLAMPARSSGCIVVTRCAPPALRRASCPARSCFTRPTHFNLILSRISSRDPWLCLFTLLPSCPCACPSIFSLFRAVWQFLFHGPASHQLNGGRGEQENKGLEGRLLDKL